MSFKDKISIVYANANGNTFLLFDALKFTESIYDKNNLYEFVKNYHKEYSYDKIDTCCVISFNKVLKKTLYINVYLIEKNFEGENSFCANGSRAIAHYLYNEYKQYEKIYILFIESKIELIKNNQDYEIIINKKNCIDFGNIFYKNNNKNIFLLSEYNIIFFYKYVLEPHLITFIPLSEKKIIEIGNYIQKKYKNIFPYGVHVNSIDIINSNKLSICTYEKGAMRTTASCGTGSIALYLLVKEKNILDRNLKNIIIKNKGGDLVIREENNKIYLKGETLIKKI